MFGKVDTMEMYQPPHAISSDMSQVINDATSTMDNVYDDAIG